MNIDDMVTLDQVKDVPFVIRVRETNAFIREIPFNDQLPRKLGWPVDFNQLACHALHNYYCISFINCPFHLTFDNLIYHFDWVCRYLYFNFEESVLRLEIFSKLAQHSWDRKQLEYLIRLLSQYPAAYSYSLEIADNAQKWALLKLTNFMECPDFRQLIKVDRSQRLLLLECLQDLFNRMILVPIQAEQLPDAPITERSKPASRTAKREASLYNFLRLNEDLSAQTQRAVIDFLFELLEPCFRHDYSRKDFVNIFYSEDSRDLELVKKSTMDNQSFKVLFHELKKARILPVSWEVINKKVRVYKPDGTTFSSFSECSAGKIDPKKSNKIKRYLAEINDMVIKELGVNIRK